MVSTGLCLLKMLCNTIGKKSYIEHPFDDSYTEVFCISDLKINSKFNIRGIAIAIQTATQFVLSYSEDETQITAMSYGINWWVVWKLNCARNTATIDRFIARDKHFQRKLYLPLQLSHVIPLDDVSRYSEYQLN